jgi:hypothetical protein
MTSDEASESDVCFPPKAAATAFDTSGLLVCLTNLSLGVRAEACFI